MKIWIVSSAIESLSLFKFLNRYEHQYFLYLDTLNASYGEKKFETSLEKAKAWLEKLVQLGAEKVILPPLYELALLQEGNPHILPLFQSYLLEEVLPFSLVGKLGILWDSEEILLAQDFFKKLESQFSPTTQQQSTKKFSFPFHYRSKESNLLKHLFTHLSRKSLLSNTVLKHELRYFKDAMVDSVIPLNYCIFNGEKTIKKFFNFKKIRFHWLEKIEKKFKKLTAESENSPYQVNIFSTDTQNPLKKEKKWLWILERGKNNPIERL